MSQPRRRQRTRPRAPAVASARRVAYEALCRIDHHDAYANLVLGPMLERSGLSDADRRFVTDLVYGTTRMRRACDAQIDRFVSTPPDDATRTLLRLGTYQLIFGGVPAHAAVGETVALASQRTRGFINAVLRRIATSEPQYASLGAELSYPDWIVDTYVAEAGAEAGIAALRRMNQAPPVTTRADGYVQDLSSQWVAASVSVDPDDVVLDVCAAPGGKATAIAERGARVVASDVRAGRTRLVESNIDRLGLASRCHVVVADATHPPYPPECADAVLIDAPCSGLGALRRRADARWRVEPTDIAELADLQRRILLASSPLVRVGGHLVYSVCTITAAESVDHPSPPGFEVDSTPPPVGTWQSFEQGWRVLPHEADTDGMVLIRYRRTR